MSVKTKEEAQEYCYYLMKSGYVASCVPVQTEEEWMIDLTFKRPPERVDVKVEVQDDQ